MGQVRMNAAIDIFFNLLTNRLDGNSSECTNSSTERLVSFVPAESAVLGVVDKRESLTGTWSYLLSGPVFTRVSTRESVSKVRKELLKVATSSHFPS